MRRSRLHWNFGLLPMMASDIASPDDKLPSAARQGSRYRRSSEQDVLRGRMTLRGSKESSREGFAAQVEGDGDARTVAAMGKDHMRHIAGKQDNQPGSWIDIDFRPIQVRQKRGAAPLAGIGQMKQGATVGIRGIARVDVVGSRPRRSGMHMHLVELTMAIDICPSLKPPFDGSRLLTVLLLKALCCLVGDRKYMSNKALASTAAEVKLPGFGMPAAVVRLDNPRTLGCVCHDPILQEGIELRTILQHMHDQWCCKEVYVAALCGIRHVEDEESFDELFCTGA